LTSVDARHHTLTDTYNICKCYMLMIFSVIIYVIKMLGNEAIDIAVAVANALRIYF